MKLDRRVISLRSCSSGLGHEELKEFGDAIEEQTAVLFPQKQDDNLFGYEGEIEVHIHTFWVGDLKVERAKARFSKDINYWVHLKKMIVAVIRLYLLDDKPEWTLESPENLTDDAFDQITKLIDLYENRIQSENN